MYQEHEETYIIILIIALGVLFIFIIFCYLIYKQFQKNRKLFIEKLNAEYIGKGEERRRISKDLHDEFGALLLGDHSLSYGIPSPFKKSILSSV